MGAIETYLTEVKARLEKIDNANIELVAQKVFSSLVQGGVWNIFGAGHSHMVVEEAFHRAGGLIPINPFLEEYLMPHASPARNGPMERLSGLAKIIFDFYKPQKSEVLTVISNSGINPTSIEMAELGNSLGLTTVAITNLEQSRGSKSRHSSGKRLFEVAQVVIDTGGVKGDAVVKIPGLDVPVGPLSTILGGVVINSIAIRVCEIFSEQGKTAPVYLSANLPGGDERNKKLEEKYRSRIPRLQ